MDRIAQRVHGRRAAHAVACKIRGWRICHGQTWDAVLDFGRGRVADRWTNTLCRRIRNDTRWGGGFDGGVEDWYAATVPSTVFAALVAQHMYPERTRSCEVRRRRPSFLAWIGHLGHGYCGGAEQAAGRQTQNHLHGPQHAHRRTSDPERVLHPTRHDRAPGKTSVKSRTPTHLARGHAAC